ncbi:MAG: hypothetical protein U9O95_08635 [Candidatus Marinimicrobia bacterium]|nr:hypothetical protein [Candidatus Neomarinimicrobiota bacterium]
MKKILLILMIGIFSFAFAQDLVDVIAPLHSYNYDDLHFNGTYGYTFPLRASALQMDSPLGSAIGHATVASGQMIPEYTVNPANLGMTKYSSIQVNGLFNNYNGVNSNSLGGITYIVSVPVYSGSMNYAAGVNKVKDYNLYFQDDDILQRSKGGLYNWHFSGAIEMQKDIFVGAEVSLLTGSKNNDIDFKDVSSSVDGFIEDSDYFGATARIGMTYHVLPVLNIGLSMDLPSVIDVDYSIRSYYASGSDNVNYDITSPAVYRAGLALTLRILDLYYSYDYSNWQSLKFTSKQMLQSAIDEINREIVNNFSVVGSHHFGMALHVPLLPLHFYFGYQYLPEVYQGLNAFSLANIIPRELTDRFSSSFSWGASFFLKQGLSISAAFETYHLFYNGVEEKPRSMNLSMAYFF